MTIHHKLLRRQLQRHLEGTEPPREWSDFLQAVSAAYQDFDTDRRLIERSLEVMSLELTERNAQLQVELAERKAVERALLKEQAEQAALIKKLEEAHHQLLQSEKMASIGQLAAGVAHEINNPIGFVSSNLVTLGGYFSKLIAAMSVYERQMEKLGSEAKQLIAAALHPLDLAYTREDGPELLAESMEGIRRVSQIVSALKDFSHIDEGHWVWADLHKGLDSTLNIVNNEIKYVADVEKHYEELPEIQCVPSQLNQVFLNMLVNASHAIKGKRGTITLRTSAQPSEGLVTVEISDNGEGIEPQHLKRIFDPFFTTKPVGTGTGLGLSLSYGIVETHGGRIEVQSELGRGTSFRIVLPMQHSAMKSHGRTPPSDTPTWA